MTQRLLLVDFENVHRVDLSPFDESYSAIVFLGAAQNAPKALANKRTANRFKRVTFHKVIGTGKNALDFHIAFQLGRVFETSPKTVCFVVSRDKGFDPLVAHVNKIGLSCRRVGSFDELAGLVCGRCNRDVTIDHNGGRWCSNCGDFAAEPDAHAMEALRHRSGDHSPEFGEGKAQLQCGWCYQTSGLSDGMFDEGEWICGSCMTGSMANSDSEID